MDKAEKKRLRRELDEKEEIRKALAKTRKIGEDIDYQGVGLLRTQILICPSFREGECWDFREKDSEIVVYKSVLLAEEGIVKPGYFEVEVDAEFVKVFIAKLMEFKIPTMVSQESLATADGTSYRVRITSGVENHLSLSWASTPPNEWSEFIDFITDIVETLRASNINEIKV